jgi:hypothetical protein
MIGNNMDGIRCETGVPFRTKNRDCLKDRHNKLETNSKSKNM